MGLSKRFALVGFVLIIIFAISFGSFFYLNLFADSKGAAKSVEISYSPFESLALMWVAQDQGIFEHNGINVTLIKYDTGAGALNGMLKGEADVVLGTTEFPLTVSVLNENDVRTFASMSESQFIYMVGRKDRGIENPSDLRGKIVGTTLGTIAQFYMGNFLSLNGVNLEEITVVDLKTPEEWVNAVVDGSVDAVCTAQPYANLAEEGLGSNAVVWSAQSHRPLFTQVISSSQWIKQNPETIENLLKSLIEAEKYTAANPEKAKAVVKREMNLTDEYMQTVWVQNRFRVALDQAQIVAMEDEVRWLISEKLTNALAVPDLLDYIYFDGLESVRPQSINIIR